MRIIILTLLVAACVSADLFDLKKSLVVGSLKGLIKHEVNKKIKKTISRIKEVIDSKMNDFRKKLSGYREKILQSLHLSKEQRNELVERLKMLKRKTIDKVLPTGDTIEEINEISNISDSLFQGDMVLTEKQQKQVLAAILGNRSKRQATYESEYPGAQVQSVFKKAAHQWMSDTCINFIPTKFGNAMIVGSSSSTPLYVRVSAEDSIRVVADSGCWSYVGRLGGAQDLSLGEGCE
ncbi:hypothetical protein OSTOST_19716, partial [Ostertagia ostertagi]